ncbi:SDR family oxidoreductase [Streptomyces sp. NPDC048282]|uniref:SDR family oxidoreductase n=1 Tax=Streptomyces sp. NPDC048282 TaxID=3365528 RepID=UPI00371CB0A8
MPYQSVFTPGLFAGRSVVVTGGGSGIGRCTAHELASLGASVAIVGRDPGRLAAVAEEIRADGGTVTPHATDIRDESGVAAVVDEVLAAHGRIDGLVNNAGGQYRAELSTITTKGFEAVVRTNLTGGFIVMREVYNRWMARHGGAVVNMIADIWHGWPHFSHSAAARGGMLTLSESAATEWASSGVRVNTVAPGSIASSGLDTYDDADRDFIQHEVAREIPLQRFGTEAEVSAAIVFLLSPAASFITGTCVRIDGGAPNAKPGWWQLRSPERGERFDGFHRSRLPEILDPAAS